MKLLGRAVARSCLERKVRSSNLGPVKSGTELLTARHCCNISSKGAVLPQRNDAEMGNSLHASAYYREYNERLNLIFDFAAKTQRRIHFHKFHDFSQQIKLLNVFANFCEWSGQLAERYQEDLTKIDEIFRKHGRANTSELIRTKKAKRTKSSQTCFYIIFMEIFVGSKSIACAPW